MLPPETLPTRLLEMLPPETLPTRRLEMLPPETLPTRRLGMRPLETLPMRRLGMRPPRRLGVWPMQRLLLETIGFSGTSQTALLERRADTIVSTESVKPIRDHSSEGLNSTTPRTSSVVASCSVSGRRQCISTLNGSYDVNGSAVDVERSEFSSAIKALTRLRAGTPFLLVRAFHFHSN